LTKACKYDFLCMLNRLFKKDENRDGHNFL
jgi:hypothetical protein